MSMNETTTTREEIDLSPQEIETIMAQLNNKKKKAKKMSYGSGLKTHFDQKRLAEIQNKQSK